MKKQNSALKEHMVETGKRHQIILFLDELQKFKPIRKGQSNALEKFADLLDVAVLNSKKADMQNALEHSTMLVNNKTKLLENLLTNYYRRWLFDNKRMIV